MNYKIIHTNTKSKQCDRFVLGYLTAAVYLYVYYFDDVPVVVGGWGGGDIREALSDVVTWAVMVT